MTLTRMFRSLILALLLPVSGFAQTGWTLQGFMPPGTEAGIACVYCPPRQSLLLVAPNVIFEGVGTTWTQVATFTSPAGCAWYYGHAAYWDSSRGQLVVAMSGINNAVEVHRWTPGSWTSAVTTVGSNFQVSAAYYDTQSGRGVVVLQEGLIVDVPPIGALRVILPPTVPFLSASYLSSYYSHVLRASCFDVHRRRVIALVGWPTPVLWEFDVVLGAWFQGPTLPQGFQMRGAATLGYDELRRITVIFGGQSTDASGGPGYLQMPLNDVWHYDGTQVWQATPGVTPLGRRDGCFLWHPIRQELWLVGGGNVSFSYLYSTCNNLRDIWSYIPGQPGVDYTFFGNGCNGSAGTPYLELLPNTLPYAGRPFSLMVKNAPFFAPVFMMIGASDQSWYGNALPLSLTPLGAPLCSLLTGPDLVYPATNLFGTALWTATLPTGIGGATIFNQAVVFDPGANPLGLTLSNGGRALVGR